MITLSANISNPSHAAFLVSLVFNFISPDALLVVSAHYAHNQRITDNVFISKIYYGNALHLFKQARRVDKSALFAFGLMDLRSVSRDDDLASVAETGE